VSVERRDPTTDVTVLLWCALIALALCLIVSFLPSPR
jgi:hypothetical protein